MKSFGNKKTFYVILLTLAVLIAVLIAVAFRLITHAPQNDSEQTQLIIYNSWGNSSSKNIAFSDIIENYGSTVPNVHITNTSLTPDKFYTKLWVDFSAGCQADIIITEPSYDMAQLYKKGYIACLNSELAQDRELYDVLDKDSMRFTTDNASGKDEVYGLPLNTQYIVLYYNTKIFNRYGLEPPESYYDFRNIVSDLAKSGITAVALGAMDSNAYLYQILTAMSENSETDEPNSAVPQQYYNSFAYMKELYNLGAFPDEYDSLTQNDAKNLFLNGSAAMIVETGNFINDILEYASTRSNNYSEYINQFDMLAFPTEMNTFENQRAHFSVTTYNGGDFTIFVNKKSYNTKCNEIIAFIKYLLMTDTLRLYIAKTNDIISVKNIENSAYQNPLITKYRLAVGESMKITSMPIDLTYRYIWISQICGQMPEILTGTANADNVLYKLQEMTNQAQSDTKGTEQP